MAQYELVLPKMGESVAEATIIKWLKNEGDKIAADESILEIATDKVDSEIPSPVEGVLVKRLFNEGDVVQVGKVIATIETEVSAGSNKPAAAPTAPASSSSSSSSVPISAPATHHSEAIETPRVSEGGKFFSPLVRNIAKSEGIGVQELENITGTGQHGRITKSDILAYIPNRNKNGGAKAPSTSTAASASITATPSAPAAAPSNGSSYQLHNAPQVSAGENDEIIEMDRMRKLIADHMVMSKHVSPHVTSYVEADVTNMVLWREKTKKDFEKREKEKITFTPIFIEAVARALKEFPMVNVSVSGTSIIIRKNINIGMATALPSGNLIVPVIKNADQMNLLGLTKSVNDLANRARQNKLKPDEIQSGTFTITNVGSFGNVMGTPIINQPQVAILAVGAIRKKPAVIETPQGDSIGIRHMMFLSLSYDHRVVDGALGGTFLRRVGDILEGFDNTRIV